jgi:hypothetical protein
MDEHDLLVRHLADWASKKKRSFDRELVSEALELRWQHDELAAGDWPSGSAERLLLVTWPAYGQRVEDPEALVTALDTLWRFLRATGRMRSGSAAPTELRAEARRASAGMAAAFDDPSSRSIGSVLLDFGRERGIDLDGAEDLEDAQARLDLIQAAWNALPDDERRRLMPDRGPKSVRGARFSEEANAMLGADDEPTVPRGDLATAAAQARSSPFVTSCLALADWVGERRAVTDIGVLRPAVAREAYVALDLWQWERTHGRPHYPDEVLSNPETDRLLAQTAMQAWSTAADCDALHRLWFAAVSADLVEVRRTFARRLEGRGAVTDREWVQLAALLVVANAVRMGGHAVEPLLGALMIANLDGDGASMAEIRDWWYSRIPATTVGDEEFWQRLYDNRLDAVFDEFDDTGIWERDDTSLALTDLGRECTLALLAAVDAGILHPDS